MILMPKFATWFSGHNYPGEDFSGCDYIVDSKGYEPLPRLIERLCRGEFVGRTCCDYDGEGDELDDLPEVPEIDDFVDAQQVRDDITASLSGGIADGVTPNPGVSGTEEKPAEMQA